jgi:hypothetical protein
MRSLNEVTKKIHDQHLHRPMSASESLPRPSEMDFRGGLATLLADIVQLSQRA